MESQAPCPLAHRQSFRSSGTNPAASTQVESSTFMIKVALCALCAWSMNEKVREGVGLRQNGTQYDQSWVSCGQFNEEWTTSQQRHVPALMTANPKACMQQMQCRMSSSCSGVQGVVVPRLASNHKVGPEATVNKARSD